MLYRAKSRTQNIYFFIVKCSKSCNAYVQLYNPVKNCLHLPWKFYFKIKFYMRFKGKVWEALDFKIQFQHNFTHFILLKVIKTNKIGQCVQKQEKYFYRSRKQNTLSVVTRSTRPEGRNITQKYQLPRLQGVNISGLVVFL